MIIDCLQSAILGQSNVKIDRLKAAVCGVPQCDAIIMNMRTRRFVRFLMNQLVIENMHASLFLKVQTGSGE